MAEETTNETAAAAAGAAPVNPKFRYILGEKLGMTQLFEGATVIPVTAVRAGPCPVVTIRTKEKDGYNAVQIGYGPVRTKNLSKAYQGHFKASGAAPSKHLREFRIEGDGYALGQVVTLENRFKPGDYVDVQGVTKGRGFAGVMKRHRFRGLPASHGASDKERSPGSLASRRSLGRVMPGQRMAGHMGHEHLTILKLEVAKVVPEENLIYVKGAVPGVNGGLVVISETTRPIKAKIIRVQAKPKKVDPLKAAKAAAKGGKKK